MIEYDDDLKENVTTYAHAPPNPHGSTYYAVVDPLTGEGYGHSVSEAAALAIAESESANFHVRLVVEKRTIVHKTGSRGN